MVKAVFPGSFDPPSYGHLNIIERVQGIFEEILVVVAVNRQKTAFSLPKNAATSSQSFSKPYPNVSVQLCDRLIVEFARDNGCKVLIRGVRNVTDFSYEFDLSILNKGLDPEIETMFIATIRDISCSDRVRSRSWLLLEAISQPWCRPALRRQSRPKPRPASNPKAPRQCA